MGSIQEDPFMTKEKATERSLGQLRAQLRTWLGPVMCQVPAYSR